ncbi:hypothetical protein J7T55_002814 [Diaporthe amygdali]|uniref:uncharacterized protein n=1 Tax=Phomopsis amygdali TaxID=1214568 RepID=UPI0022FF27E7|nr:uncharacterized protein J7T55_002814 [Diaporthe amygdali]KAJ0122301.1 hypothetical protein J7T55_002814 [Diaporthe amygdali]
MEDSESSWTAGSKAAVVILCIFTFILVSACPMVLVLLWLKVKETEYYRNIALREGNLPTTEQPICKRTRQNPLSGRVRQLALKMRGMAIAVGGALALQCRKVFEKARGCISGLFDSHRRRRNGSGSVIEDLPIMRHKAWQKLAESHTEDTVISSKDDAVELKTVENPNKVTKAVHFDLGSEDSTEPCVQKPKPAVVAGSKI